MCDASVCDASVCDTSVCDASVCDASVCDASVCDASVCDASVRDASRCNGAWVTRPERPKGVKDVIKQAEGPKAGPKGRKLEVF